MSRHAPGSSGKPRWSKLKSRVEALFAPGLELAIHCNVFIQVRKVFTFDEPRHWVVLGHGRHARILWDFPGPFLRPGRGMAPRSARGQPLDSWEEGYGYGAPDNPSRISALLHEYLERPRTRLMEPVEDPWELAAILRAADRRLGRNVLLAWGSTLDAEHPACPVLHARFSHGRATASPGAGDPRAIEATNAP